MVPLEEITPTLSPLLLAYKTQRHDSESFGDFCHRQGLENLESLASAG